MSDDFDSADDFVDDPEALRRAEQAVSHMGEDPAEGPRKPIDEDYVVVAKQLQPGDNVGLDDVVRALESDDVDFGWDPYDPRDTVNFMPPNAGLTARKLFSVTVPASEFARARETLYGAPPQGVTYAWDDSAIPPEPSGSDFASDARGVPTPMGGAPGSSGFDPTLSDNARLAGLTGAGLPAGAVIGLVIVVLIAAGIFVASQIAVR